MTQQTKIAQTAHGDIQYETVECSSCGEEMMKEGAHRFVMMEDSHTTLRTYSYQKKWAVENGGYREGYACEYCYSDGPISFPTVRRATGKLNELYEAIFIDSQIDMWRFGTMVYFVASLALWILVILYTLGGA